LHRDSNMVRIILTLWIFIFLFSFKLFSQQSDKDVIYSNNETFYLDLLDKQSPKWILNNLYGDYYTLDDFLGNLVLIEIWGTNCGVCIKTAKEVCFIDSLYKSKGLKVIGIEGDGRCNLAQIKKFKNDFNLNYFTLLGGKEISNKYGVIGFPTFFLIDKNGRIIYTSMGRLKGDNYTNLIEKIENNL